jgi:hypothetical protein
VRDVLFALLAIAAGAVFCFAGFVAFRLVIPLWGAFVGFALGAGIVATAGDGFLRTSLSWLVGLAVALVFALLAYLFYEVAVVLAMGSIGVALGTSLMVALGVDWTWVIAIAAVAAGILLAVLAIRVNLPLVLLIVLSAFAGAGAITSGLMLLFGTIDTADFDHDRVTAQAGDDWWWYVVYLVLAIAGVVIQSRAAAGLTRSLRETWDTERSGATAPPAGT